MIPYRAPAPRPVPRYRIEGVELVLQEDAQLPELCLICGSRQDVRLHARSLTTQGAAGAAGGAAGGVVGSAIARGMKQDLFLTIAIGAVLAGVLGGVLWLIMRPKPGDVVKADLPICNACDAKAHAAQGRSRVLALVGLALFVLSFVVLSQKVWLLAAICFVAAGVLVVFATRETKNVKVVRARLVSGGEAFLVGVGPRAVARLSGARPDRKRKKKKVPPGLLPPRRDASTHEAEATEEAVEAPHSDADARARSRASE